MNRKKKIKERIRRTDLFLFYQLNLLLYLLNTMNRTILNDEPINTTKNPELQITQLQMNIKQLMIKHLCHQNIIGKIKGKLLEIVKQFKKLDYKRWSLQWINKIITSSTAKYKILAIPYPKESKKIVLPLDFALNKLSKSLVHKNFFYIHAIKAIIPYITSLQNIDKEAVVQNVIIDSDIWNKSIHVNITDNPLPQCNIPYKRLDSSYGWIPEYDRNPNNPFIFDIDIRKLQQFRTLLNGKSFFFGNELLYNSCTHTILLWMNKILKKYNI